ncbi:MAG TPA: zinc ribbon domain-containing protein [Vicinamibacterales bacterium]|jgi:putative FmdB family regulatory protein|nr:zinc ribbon domain-containing protein [Vicinamibacterales bacterium]
MPIYDLQCHACGHQFEALVRQHDAPPECPACHSRDLERLLSSFAVSSAEKTHAAATIARKKAASIARRDNVAMDREAEMHRREDH